MKIRGNIFSELLFLNLYWTQVYYACYMCMKNDPYNNFFMPLNHLRYDMIYLTTEILVSATTRRNVFEKSLPVPIYILKYLWRWKIILLRNDLHKFKNFHWKVTHRFNRIFSFLFRFETQIVANASIPLQKVKTSTKRLAFGLAITKVAIR